MHVRVITPHAPLVDDLTARLTEGGHTVQLSADSVSEFDLRYGPDTPIDEVSALVELLKPLLPAVVKSPEIEGSDVELRLGDRKPFSAWEVKLRVDNEAIAERLRPKLDALGFRPDGVDIEEVTSDGIQYGGASPLARQVVRWLLDTEGVESSTESKAWSDSDDDIWVSVRDPELIGKTPRQRTSIQLVGDDYERLFALRERLETVGFERVAVRSLDSAHRPQFRIDRGPLASHLDDVAALEEVVQATLSELGVDAARHPLTTTPADEQSEAHTTVVLPLGAHAEGRLRPWAGAFPERWEVIVRTDRIPDTQPLVVWLQEQGFASVRTQALPDSALGFAVRGNAACRSLGVLDQVHEQVLEAISELDVGADYPFTVSDALPDTDDSIMIELPLAASAHMSFEERVQAAARNWELTLKCPRPDDYADLQTALKVFPWKAWSAEVEGDVEAKIQYGGAPLALLEYVRDLIEVETGHRLGLEKAWGNGDDDIWVHLPRVVASATDDDNTPLDLSAWLAADEDLEPESLIEVTADRVRVGPVTLPRRSDGDQRLVPRPEPFAHYCLDERTAQSLVHVAESVLLREPCLLEGETSVSKTSIIQYLGMLVGQPVVRLNLNGQTDTGELVGRYVPQDMATALPMDPAELLAAAELLESESRMILERASQAGRTLTRVEVQQIMANERMTVHPWRWQDGLVVTAMKKGWWVVLDELNLAEPQILERLNPVLERDPSLVLTEHDNSVIGAGGHPIHPNFRVFATMNPAEYAGRSPLSPAYRDRWRAYRFVSPPGEAEYLAMLRYLVFGDQPSVHVHGATFTGGRSDPPLGTLADVDGIGNILRALARFHAALEEAVGRQGRSRGGQLGGRRRERYVFSRRGLLAVMDYLGSHAHSGHDVQTLRRALARYYLGRVQPGSDQRVVARLLDAAGIGPNTWAPDRIDQIAEEADFGGEE